MLDEDDSISEGAVFPTHREIGGLGTRTRTVYQYHQIKLDNAEDLAELHELGPGRAGWGGSRY